MRLNVLGLDIDYKDAITTSTGNYFKINESLKRDKSLDEIQVEIAQSILENNRVIVLGFLNLRSEVLDRGGELHESITTSRWDRFINVLRKAVADRDDRLLIFAAPNYPLVKICSKCNGIMSIIFKIDGRQPYVTIIDSEERIEIESYEKRLPLE